MTDLLLVVWLYFNLFFLIGLIKKDFSVIDIAWGPSFFLVYLIGFISNGTELNIRVFVIGSLTFIWAMRLAIYIWYRSKKIGEEDFRYTQWRKEWQTNIELKAYFRVYMLQAVLSLAIAFPLYLIHFQNQTLFPNVLDIIGIFLWVIGFSFEVVGDFQKQKFKSLASNNGKILQTGLWKYTRHPNYFGEALLWWGIFLLYLGSLSIPLAIIGPALLHILLLKVSGVALLEKKYEGNKEYEKYRKQTNALIPWFPKVRS